MNEQIKTHKDLLVWQKSVEFVTEIYRITNEYPKTEIYGLTNQMRRCAVSVPSNISEGAARKNKKEFLQFCYISLGSIAELDTQLIISLRLDFISQTIYKITNSKLTDIRKLLLGLIRKLKN